MSAVPPHNDGKYHTFQRSCRHYFLAHQEVAGARARIFARSIFRALPHWEQACRTIDRIVLTA